MKIKTNAGEVELTAEMVCRGMVFTAADYHLGGGLFVVGRRDDANNVWRDAGDDGLGTNLLGAQRFLGCDPAIASRADCERFGVHGDAAAHGFARLRDGGALDLRREIPTSAVCSDAEGRRFTAYGRGLQAREGDRFIGLDTRHASPGDVRRLCCGADGGAKEGTTGRRVICTLAIGDHDTHEDLATGVKWSAKRGLPDMQVASGEALDRLATFYGAEPRRHGESCEALRARAWSTVRGAMTNAKQAAGPYRTAPVGPCPNCGGDDATCRGSLVGLRACAAKGAPPPTVQWTSDSGFTYREDVTGNGFRVGGPYHVGVDPAQPGTEATAFVSSAMRKAGESLARFGEAAKRAAESAMRVPAAIEWRHGSASLGQSQAHVIRDGDVYRWQVNHLGLRIREGVEPHASPAMIRAGDLLRAVHDATAGIEWLAKFFGLLFRVHDSTPAAMRAKQEAPLVALVAAVPAGLDPIGWQAAVLAEAEGPGHLTSSEAREFGAQVEAAVRGRDVMAFPNALAAYQRAIAPAHPVDRVRATWKTRGPVLPCDNGWDE